VIGGENSPAFEFQSRYIEHYFEARATLPPILDVCVAAFCFAFFQKTMHKIKDFWRYVRAYKTVVL